jgi:hypothetical protein
MVDITRSGDGHMPDPGEDGRPGHAISGTPTRSAILSRGSTSISPRWKSLPAGGWPRARRGSGTGLINDIKSASRRIEDVIKKVMDFQTERIPPKRADINEAVEEAIDFG